MRDDLDIDFFLLWNFSFSILLTELGKGFQKRGKKNWRRQRDCCREELGELREK